MADNDVSTKAHASITGINNGSVVMTTKRVGESQTITPDYNQVPYTSGEMNTKWSCRLDNNTYYTN